MREFGGILAVSAGGGVNRMRCQTPQLNATVRYKGQTEDIYPSNSTRLQESREHKCKPRVGKTGSSYRHKRRRMEDPGVLCAFCSDGRGCRRQKLSTESLRASTAALRNTQEDARRLYQPDITWLGVNDASEQRERWVRVKMGSSALRGGAGAAEQHFAGLAFVRDAREPLSAGRSPHASCPSCFSCLLACLATS